MPDFTRDISFMRELDPSGKLEAWARALMESHNHAAAQANVAPVGKVDAPPKISSVAVTASGGVHNVVIQDNNPVQQGIVYHFEYSRSKDFPSGQVYLAQTGPSRSLTGLFLGKGQFFWRAYSQQGQASPPSEPVYFGTETAPTAVDAGGTITGAIPPASTGTGTDQGIQPQGGQGFGPGHSRTLERDTENPSLL